MLRLLFVLFFYAPLILCENDDAEISQYWQLGDIIRGIAIFGVGKVPNTYRLLGIAYNLEY